MAAPGSDAAAPSSGVAATESTAPASKATGAPLLRAGIKLAYGAPGFAGAGMAIPLMVHLTIFYSDTVLVPLGLIALVKALVRALDAVTDPIMGWITDRTRTRWGRRRPWILAGAPFAALSFVALFTPPESVLGLAGAAWLAATYTLYYLFHTVYVIPHYALGPELTLDYKERNSLFVYREAFVITGTLCASVLPAFLIAAFGLRAAYMVFAVSFGTILTLAYINLVVRVRERPDFVNRPPNPLVPGVRRMMRNRAFRVLLIVYVVAATTAAIPGVMVPYMLKYVLRAENPDSWLGFLLACYFGSGFLAMPLWLWAANRFGKKPTWLCSFVPHITAGIPLLFLGEGDMPYLAMIMIWQGSGSTAGAFLGPSMQADVIDYDELHSGRRREAQYAGAWSVAMKFISIPSLSIPLAILASMGFEPNVRQNETVELTIRMLYCLAPMLNAIVAFSVALFYPIDQRTHQRIWDGIEKHKRGEVAVDPLTERVVPPPAGRGVDEETGWFLDHFSMRELRRVRRSGASSLVRSAVAATALSLAIAAVAAWLTAHEVAATSGKPGFVALLCVVVAGFALTASIYHGMRLRAARRFRRSPPMSEELDVHISLTERLKRGGLDHGEPASFTAS
jgi:GPH family glycoside/pentoside/hexuronide:cation symporter